MEKYSWSFKEHNEIWSNGAGSIKACLCQARQAAAADENVVYVGENIPFIPTVSAESILEDLEAQASDFGGEIGEDCEKVSVYEAVERKRQKGCPYCTGNVNERPLLLEEVGGVYIDGNGNMTIEDDGAAINYCYMCGRDLKGENNDNGAGN